MLPEYLKPYKASVTFKDYKESKSKRGIPNAKSALHNACYGYYSKEVTRKFESNSLVRVTEEPDYDCDLEHLLGDSFNPDCVDHIPPHVLKQQEQEEIDRINREGVWGYIAEYYDGTQWVQADSIWGFVGSDFEESGYKEDLMESALDALETHLQSVANEFEQERPDMYL